jgi:hypothetical protein
LLGNFNCIFLIKGRRILPHGNVSPGLYIGIFLQFSYWHIFILDSKQGTSQSIILKGYYSMASGSGERTQEWKVPSLLATGTNRKTATLPCR